MPMTDPNKKPQEQKAGEAAKGKGKKAKQSKDKYDFFRRKRGGALLTRAEVKEIKAGRKKLKKELRKIGERSRKEFEITASSLGLYFDGNRFRSIIKWFVAIRGLWVLLITGLVLLFAICGFAIIAEMKGHFTINMSDDMFREGFSISEDEEFEHKTSHLFATPAVGVSCISIVDIPDNVDDIDGEHGGKYFAYTFYLRNEGESEVDYQWELRLKSNSAVAEAAWVMIFIDGEMTLYAKANDDGTSAALPEWGNNTFGYLDPPLYDHAADKSQYEVIATVESLTYWRVIPKPFLSESIVAGGRQEDIGVGEIHKYTVVVWLEGDDPDCTNALIGKHLGLEMHMKLIEE